MAEAVLYDSTLCIGCRQCEQACAAGKNLAYNDKIARGRVSVGSEVDDDPHPRGAFFPASCACHCLDPNLRLGVPGGGTREDQAGSRRSYHRRSVHGVPLLHGGLPLPGAGPTEWHSRLPRMRKRYVRRPAREGSGDAMQHSVSDERHHYRRTRSTAGRGAQAIADNPTQYYRRSNGVAEAGGTSVFVIAAVPFSQIAYNTGNFRNRRCRLSPGPCCAHPAGWSPWARCCWEGSTGYQRARMARGGRAADADASPMHVLADRRAR